MVIPYNIFTLRNPNRKKSLIVQAAISFVVGVLIFSETPHTCLDTSRVFFTYTRIILIIFTSCFVSLLS